jgi:hypothetical protein
MEFPDRFDVRINLQKHGGPVGVMNYSLGRLDCADIVVKLDNDTIVPPGWLDRCLDVMARNPHLGILGIEPPSSTVRISLDGHEGRGYAPTEAIGGIGAMRRAAFDGPDKPHPHAIYGGFTDWQLRHPEIEKGWIFPSLDIFLLDRLPMDPWLTLSQHYIATGQQRSWKKYGAEDEHLWAWWNALSHVAVAG